VAGKFQPPPIEGQTLVTKDSQASFAFRRWLELIPPALTSPANSGDVPETSAGQGIQGQMATDGNFLYVCVENNSWKRLPLTAF
jgi:hypothetical protein